MKIYLKLMKSELKIKKIFRISMEQKKKKTRQYKLKQITTLDSKLNI